MSTAPEDSELPNGRTVPEPDPASPIADHKLHDADDEAIQSQGPPNPSPDAESPSTNESDQKLHNADDEANQSQEPLNPSPDAESMSTNESDRKPSNGFENHAVEATETNGIESPKVADRELENPKDNGVESNEAQSSSPPAGDVERKPELRKDEGSRTFTMRELLNVLKDEEKPQPSESGLRGASSPYSQDSAQQAHQQKDQSSVAMELINSVTGVDEEGRSRQRVLTFAAGRYASAIERNPDDYDALYNWALVLQESADNVDPDSNLTSKDSLLEEACKRYEEAVHLCPTLHDAYYNWAIAISDRAKMRGRTKEAEEFWKQATINYEKAVQLNWNSPQALNNWGLALQELSSIVPAREKQTIVRTAISKFREAIRLQFDFHRAIYNLGTVLYGLAEDTLRTGGSSHPKDISSDVLYSQSSIYIAAAHALKPSYSVYHSALKLVRSMLPLPYVKVGYLTAPPPNNPVAPHNEWKLSEFGLNHEGLQQLDKLEQNQMQHNLSGRSGDTTNERMAIKVDVTDIVSVSACADLTLPPGAGLCINTIQGPIFLVADSWESLDGWLDAIRLVYTIFARGKSEVLAGIITS